MLITLYLLEEKSVTTTSIKQFKKWMTVVGARIIVIKVESKDQRRLYYICADRLQQEISVWTYILSATGAWYINKMCSYMYMHMHFLLSAKRALKQWHSLTKAYI